MKKVFGYLIKSIYVYAPKDLGIKDVLVINNKIIEVDDCIEHAPRFVKEIDGKGHFLIPGFIDQHVHILGGGGEAGFASRVPELKISELVSSGITTLVGVLGTDGVTKNIESLIAKTKELKSIGFNGFCLTGSYDFPSITLTGDVRKDIVFIEEIIGCKLAISDHRGPQITKEELLRLASKIRSARLLSGKKAYLKLHIGDDIEGLSLINQIIDETTIPIDLFRPTHVSRTDELLKEAIDFAKKGGIIDFTARPTKQFKASIEKAINENTPLTNITFSSDGLGSWSTYHQDGTLDQIGYTSLDELLKTIQHLSKEHVLSLEQLLRFVSTNVASALGLPNKGVIEVGKDADLLIVDQGFDLVHTFVNGQQIMDNKKTLIKGFYE